jgi:hypothetical protein
LGDNYIPWKNAYHIYIPPNPDNPAALSGHIPIEYCNSDWYILCWLQDSYYTNPDFVITVGSMPLGHHTLNPALTTPHQSTAIEVDPESPIAGPSALTIEVDKPAFTIGSLPTTALDPPEEYLSGALEAVATLQGTHPLGPEPMEFTAQTAPIAATIAAASATLTPASSITSPAAPMATQPMFQQLQVPAPAVQVANLAPIIQQAT